MINSYVESYEQTKKKTRDRLIENRPTARVEGCSEVGVIEKKKKKKEKELRVTDNRVVIERVG